MSQANGYNDAVSSLRALFSKGGWAAFDEYVVSLRSEGWGEHTITDMVGTATRGVRAPRRAA